MLKELMGFAAMSLWILAPFSILLIGIAVAWAAIGRAKTSRKKWAAGLLTALIAILIPTWDEILGRLYFNYLCATETDVTVYKKLELPAEYWRADGSPKFIRPNGDIDNEVLGHQFNLVTKSQQISKMFRINSLDFILMEKSSRNPIGQISSFGYFGGWLANSTAQHVTGTRCANRPRSYDEAILLATVKPATKLSK